MAVKRVTFYRDDDKTKVYSADTREVAVGFAQFVISETMLLRDMHQVGGAVRLRVWDNDQEQFGDHVIPLSAFDVMVVEHG